MAETASLLETVLSFQTSTELSTQSLPSLDSLLPPQHGVSLLDTKNEIFLSYLQALALRNLNVIRSLKEGSSVEDVQALSDAITDKLVEHRVYLERGVKPLEQKMKYQIERAVNLAGEDERVAAQREKSAKAKSKAAEDESEDSSSGSEDNEEDEPAANASAFRASGSNMNFSKPTSTSDSRPSRVKEDGVYRPPRISATSMPTTSLDKSKPTKPARSRTVDEYISTELSNAPAAEPSIGSTITASGRRTKSSRELAREQERTNYEETHLMRLPPESKKERAKQKARERRAGFGGEEWAGLGGAVDRIGDLTKKRKEGVLERARKRGRETEDGPRGSGVGEAFEKIRRRVEKKMRR